MNLRAISLVLLVECCLAVTSRAELINTEVAIVAASGNAESQAVAEYYADKRAIPARRIIPIDVPAGDELPRNVWAASIRPAIRSWIAENDPERKIRCLVPVFGVPLRISAAETTPRLLAYQKFLVAERSARVQLLTDVIKEFDSLAPSVMLNRDTAGQSLGGPADRASGDGTPPAPGDASGATSEMAALKGKLDSALKGAQSRILALPEGPTRQAAQGQMQQLVAGAGGASVILQNLNGQISTLADPPPAILAEFHRLRGAAAAWVESRELLERRPPTIERDLGILEVTERVGGQFEAIAWLDKQIADVAKNESAASFDSELALVLWPDTYELVRWQPNYLQPRYQRSYLRTALPTLMVARIDASTPALARGMVDAALAAEEDGLMGKIYFDARGLVTSNAPTPQGETGAMDVNLTRTAEGIRNQTTLEVVLNSDAALYGPGECPDAAIYCGWYSLGRYVDAFEFNRGAIAYHIASDEADGLHDVESQRWCKRLIEDGAAVTLGAVSEPYLAAYPSPDVFFSFLLRGNATLAEAYWQAIPHASWNMVLLGDPLYRPFKNRSVVKQAAPAP